MINVPTDNRLWEEVERTVWKFDREGNIMPLTDVIIGCCALRVGAVVLTFDSDFSRFPGLRVTNQLDT
jgi:predicted nucleic acid-binding protein